MGSRLTEAEPDSHETENVSRAVSLLTPTASIRVCYIHPKG